MSQRRPSPPMGGGPRGGPMGGFGGPPAKSKDFRGSLKRLLKELRGERNILIGVVALITTSVTIGAFGPKLLGRATNYIFYGYLGRKLPAGISKADAVTQLKNTGQNRLAQMLQESGVVPGQGVDFHAIARIIALVTVLYLFSSLFSWIQGYLMAGVTNRTLYRLRRIAEEKIGRLPLSYFDTQSRGDLLSRVTNDIDNIGNSLQQGLAQISRRLSPAALATEEPRDADRSRLRLSQPLVPALTKRSDRLRGGRPWALRCCRMYKQFARTQALRPIGRKSLRNYL